MERERILNITYVVGMIITLIATSIGVISYPNNTLAKYLLIVGVIPIVVVRGIALFNKKMPASRLPLIMLISSLFLIGAIVALFTLRNYWVLLIFISAILDLYASFRTPKES